jgi:hypothetical protein
MVMKPLEDMDEAELKDYFNALARLVEAALPRGARFALLVFDDPKVAQYVSNCRRPDMIEALRETSDRLARRQDVTR